MFFGTRIPLGTESNQKILGISNSVPSYLKQRPDGEPQWLYAMIRISGEHITRPGPVALYIFPIWDGVGSWSIGTV